VILACRSLIIYLFRHKSIRYNCRVFVLNRRILLIRPKLFLADDGGYREPRWFSAWQRRFQADEYYLPKMIQEITGQYKVPIGEAAIATRDTVIASESCEELFVPMSPHIPLSLSGIEILGNGSGSYHQLRKLHTRVDYIRNATAKSGGIYLYANQQGCDGGRVYFDGCAMIAINGDVVAQGSQFSLRDVEVIVASLSLDDVRSYRGSIASRGVQAANSEHVIRVDADFDMCCFNTNRIPLTSEPLLEKEKFHGFQCLSKPIRVTYFSPEEEIAYGPASWLWDYLRRSGMCGFFLPLSGGSDSAAVCAIVFIMCELIMREVQSGENAQVVRDLKHILDESADAGVITNGSDSTVPSPTNAKELCNRLLFTCYMASKNNSSETCERARLLAEQVGANHRTVLIDDIVDSFQTVFSKQISSKELKFKTEGGSNTENLALQNIQARSRMVLSYFMSQLLPWVNEQRGGLLVLGTSNVDEALRGYYTKYDCSSADINPIGGISKLDLRRFLIWAAETEGLTVLHSIANAVPTAELEPSSPTHTQSDEVDMGMSYQELSIFGSLRKIHRCGPMGMFEKLLCEWNHMEPFQIAEKVKRFFYYYSINRHKMTTLTPSYHAEAYDPDDNRFDLRPFLYDTKWSWQFKKIDEMVKLLASRSSKSSADHSVSNQPPK